MDSQRPLFTPQLLLSAPRRSAGIPNPSGTTVLFTTTSYSFQSHSQTTKFQALVVQTDETIDIATNQEISDINWLDDDRFVCLRSEKDGTTTFLYARFSAALSKDNKNTTTLQSVGTINASASCLKVARLNDDHDDFAVVIGAPAREDGRLYTPADAARKSDSSGKVYDKLFVRHWDRYKGPERNSLWYGRLSPADGGAGDQHKLSELTNLLAGTNMECPVPPFGGSDQFDVRRDAIIWLAKDPQLNPSWNTKCNVYIHHIDSWDPQEGTPTASGTRQIDVEGFDGLSASPVFARVGNKAAFLMMRRNRYEGDKNQIFVVSDVTTSQSFEVVRAFSSAEKSPLEGSWDRSPSSVCFAADGESLVVVTEDQGCDRVFSIRGEDVAIGSGAPRPLTSSGTAVDVRCLADGRIFVSGSSMIDDSWYTITPNPTIKTTSQPQHPALLPQTPTWLHSPSNSGSKHGLHPSQITSIHTPASNPTITPTIHSWIIKPSTFSRTKKYPVAYLVHGGPHAAWKDAWSTRWNPAVFAEQGYIVVAPNISGSSGYGQAFTDSSVRNWGGDPYHDFVKVFEWVGENLEGADNERAVGLGHSYGGFMVSEIVDGFWWLLWDE
jgi:dipeptidyl aminopeptidase/acylaminoacyl peptidase